MINLKTPQFSDKEWVRELLSYGREYGCEYTFGNLMIWEPVHRAKIGRYKDFLIVFVPNDKYFTVLFPIGKGDLHGVISYLKELADGVDKPLRFFNMTPQCVKMAEEVDGFKFNFTESRNTFDYVYLREDLAELKGKTYKAKRNHISFFEKNYKWNYEEINAFNIDGCFDMLLEWENEADHNDEEVMTEISCAKRAISYFFELDFFGGLVRANDKIVAFTIAEKLNGETADVHIEKAFKDVRGAYPIINREFARNNTSFKYFNREDDNGSEGLRKSKLSYNPTLLEKYTADLV